MRRVMGCFCFILGAALVVQAQCTRGRPTFLYSDPPPAVAHPLQPSAVTTAELQRDAQELAQLSASLPADMNAVSKGLLPADLKEKLKRIEKLSKKMRSQVAP